MRSPGLSAAFLFLLPNPLRAEPAGALRQLEDQAGTEIAASLHLTVAALSSEAMEGRAPMTKGSRLAREYIIEKMKSYGLAPGGEDETFVEGVHKRLFGTKIGHNVVGFVPGRTKPEECVYVDAHYDHWGNAGGELQPGANDNASGVALMLELARTIAMLRPDRTVVFLASDYEEGALLPMLGAIKGANAHVRRPLCVRKQVKAAIVLDTVGGPFVPGLESRLFLLGSESSPQTYALAGKISEDAALPVKRLGVYAIEPLGQSVPRADYGAYRKISVPFIFATSGLSPDYHDSSDTIDKLDFNFMEKAGEQILRLVLAMASEGFEPAFAARPADVLDWDQEGSALDQFLGDILGLESHSPEKASNLKKLRALRERLSAQGASGKPDRRTIKKTARKTVIEILKMNGSLKFWEHIYRTHGVPHEND